MTLMNGACLGSGVRNKGHAKLQPVMRSVVIAALLTQSIAPAIAQSSSSDTSRSVPYGSPLGGDGSSSDSSTRRSSRDSETQSGTDYTQSELIEPVSIEDDSSLEGTSRTLRSERLYNLYNPRVKPLKPGEFEEFIEERLGRKIARFGADLLLPSNRDYAVPATATVPPDYILGVGDTIIISLTGSVDGRIQAKIDTDGRIFVPKVGAVDLAGVRYADLTEVVSRAIGRQYRGYDVAVTINDLRGVRVYVTGFANNPGAYTVNSLSTMVNAVLAAGGPAGGGSFRSIQLYRKGHLVSDFDLYKLIRGGDRTGDSVLQNEDVLFIPPVGEQLAIVGSVNSEAIYEAKPGESIQDVLNYAGGPSVLADTSRLMLYRLSEQDSLSGRELAMADTGRLPAAGGDIVSILPQGSLVRSIERQAVLVQIEGEVAKPGNYYVPPNTNLETVLKMAGGLTDHAYVFGTRLERLSVKQQQRKGFEDAVQQLEISLASSPLTHDQAVGADSRDAQLAAARTLLDRLKEAKPDGRVVLDLAPDARELPGALPLENIDRIVVPPRPTTVGVFGAVYRPASFLIEPGKEPLRIREYIDRAGSTIRAADRGGIFVVRANGQVLPKKDALSARALPGDVIFVPIKTQSSSVWAKIRDISTIIFQLGIGAAALVAVTR